MTTKQDRMMVQHLTADSRINLDALIGDHSLVLCALSILASYDI